MNRFGKDITGYTGVVNLRSFFLPKNSTKAQRSFVIANGPGCAAIPGTQSTVKGTWLSDGMPDTISAYSFEYVIDLQGHPVNPLPETIDDVEPVKLPGETSVLVRRKK